MGLTLQATPMHMGNQWVSLLNLRFVCAFVMPSSRAFVYPYLVGKLRNMDVVTGDQKPLLPRFSGWSVRVRMIPIMILVTVKALSAVR